MSTMHKFTRFYLNGSRVDTTVSDEDLASVIAYNEKYRFGCFCFVDGEYVCGGVLKPEPQARKIAEFKELLQCG